jgi:hypothetical protein
VVERRLPDQEIIDLYFSGLDADAVGYRAGCHGATVLNIIKRAGLKPRRQGGVKPLKPTAWAEDRVELEYLAGMTLTTLAEKSGINRENLRRILIRRGVRLRTLKDYADLQRAQRRRGIGRPPKATR